MQFAGGLLTADLLSLGACAVPQSDNALERSFTLSAGPMTMGSKGWSGYGERVLVSITGRGRWPDWPCGVEFTAEYENAVSEDDSFDSDVEFLELKVGATEEWRSFTWLRFVVGAGPRLVEAMMTYPGTFSQTVEKDASLGFYAHAGVFVRILGGFSVGADGLWADGADYTLNNQDRDAQISALLISLRWDY